MASALCNDHQLWRYTDYWLRHPQWVASMSIMCTVHSIHLYYITLDCVLITFSDWQGHLAHLSDSNSITVPDPPNGIGLWMILKSQSQISWSHLWISDIKLSVLSLSRHHRRLSHSQPPSFGTNLHAGIGQHFKGCDMSDEPNMIIASLHRGNLLRHPHCQCPLQTHHNH